MTNKPIISIACITYNHSKYVRQALDSFLMQEVNFPVEIIIHDDASTDGTAEIIKEYSNKYPKLITQILQTKNQWSEGVKRILATFVYPICKGKYIALCEGDDYWTDPYKLQKQVNFLEMHPDYSLCCHAFDIYDHENNEFKQPLIRRRIFKKNNFAFDTRHIIGWGTQPLTMVFRKDMLISYQMSKYKHNGDIHLYYHLLKTGKGYFINEKMGVYRHTFGGIYSKTSPITKRLTRYEMYKELYQVNKDNYSSTIYFISCISLFRTHVLQGNVSFGFLKLLEGFKLFFKYPNFIYILKYYFIYSLFYLINYKSFRNR